MPKSKSPMRLEKDLVEKAALAGRQTHRSTNEQIEYWADIGQRVSRFLTPETLTQICAGLARIHVETIKATPVDPEAVFASLERDRDTGSLSAKITTSPIRYQASKAHPGMLERIDERGDIEVGQFQGGEFTVAEGVL